MAETTDTRKAMRDARALLDRSMKPVAVGMFIMGSDGQCGVVWGYDGRQAADVMARSLACASIEIMQHADMKRSRESGLWTPPN